MNVRHISCALALVAGGAAGLAAQDSTAALSDSTAAPTAAPSLTVTDAVIAKAVVDRVPQDSASTFPADVGQVACWSIIMGAKAGMNVRHVWFHGDAEVGNVELTVGGSPWRTWSRKSVPFDATGPWHVEIRDASGRLLRRVNFSIAGTGT